MQVKTNPDVPDSAYFTVQDVSPECRGGVLEIWHGRGGRRSWGCPQVTSTVVINDPDFTVVHVGFSHKHGGGQSWFYFVDSARRIWTQLPDEYRARVIAARPTAAPKWAHSPGKLRSQQIQISKRIIEAFKIVRVINGQYVSVYDPKTVYEIGKRKTQAAKVNHGGGYYAYTDMQTMLEKFSGGALFAAEWVTPGVYAVLAVQMSGTIIPYDRHNPGNPGKIAATHCKPTSEITRYSVTVQPGQADSLESGDPQQK